MLKAISAAIVMAAALVVLPAAGARSDNRCTPVTIPTVVTYNCWSAYPEGFSVSGLAASPYSIQWWVTCAGRTVASKPRRYGHVIHIYVGRLSADPVSRQAFSLMIRSDVCRVRIRASRLSGSGSITIEPFINQNHPQPAHN